MTTKMKTKIKNEVQELIERNKKRLERQHKKMLLKQWYTEQKSKAKCIRCGETDPSLLSYHHKDPRYKDYDIARLASWTSIKRLREEMEKCDVLCVYCHRKIHNHKP